MKALIKLRELSEALADSGIESAEKEAELFIRHGLDLNLVDLYRDNPELSEAQVKVLDTIAARRRSREPLQYILGWTEFLGLKIMVGPGVLIPRPETELMAEGAIKAISGQRSAVSEQRTTNDEQRIANDERRTMILDLCTGSGCLALALAREFTDAHVYGIDISEDALMYARKNAEVNEIMNIEFMRGDLFEPVAGRGCFDFIISNPPYIRSEDIQTLQPEIKEWEPLNALEGGDDGMDFYRRIVLQAHSRLKESGILMFELGDGSADTVAGLLGQTGYTKIEITKDYAGIDRIISARLI